MEESDALLFFFSRVSRFSLSLLSYWSAPKNDERAKSERFLSVASLATEEKQRGRERTSACELPLSRKNEQRNKRKQL